MKSRPQIKSVAKAASITIEIAPGELFDRATILALKARKIIGESKRANIMRQRAHLAPYERALLKQFPLVRPLVRDLARANRTLWTAEDSIRTYSKKHDFGPRFIRVAKRIHETNDERARLKRAINEVCGSTLHEEKSYKGRG